MLKIRCKDNELKLTLTHRHSFSLVKCHFSDVVLYIYHPQCESDNVFAHVYVCVRVCVCRVSEIYFRKYR